MHYSVLRRLPYVLPGVALVALTCASAAAQERHISVGAAAGVATPLHGDLDFTAGAWQVDLQFGLARFLASSVFFGQWQHTDEAVSTGVTILGPWGPLGTADRITTRTVHRTRAVGWSLLARSTGRVAVSGGGGVSYLLYSRDFSTEVTGCAPASLCTESSHEFSNNALAAQVQAGIDVEVAPHLTLMGLFRFLVPVEDPGSGHHDVTAGARFVF